MEENNEFMKLKEKELKEVSGGAGGGQTGSAVVARAIQELGKPYQWGAVGPDAYDCSGLVYYRYIIRD